MHLIEQFARRHGLSGIVTWSPDGRIYKIEDAGMFCRELMPKFMSTDKRSALTLGFKRYGFIRGVSDNEEWYFCHPLFLRDRPDLIARMKNGYPQPTLPE
jgi:hypothetical protein